MQVSRTRSTTVALLCWPVVLWSWLDVMTEPAKQTCMTELNWLMPISSALHLPESILMAFAAKPLAPASDCSLSPQGAERPVNLGVKARVHRHQAFELQLSSAENNTFDFGGCDLLVRICSQGAVPGAQ